nr:GntR family transcriptional regulator [Corallococcus sp. AS-1-6]
MGMERRGLVAYVEAQIERDIALGRLPPSGQLGSEAKLARRYEVCRGTIREALRRLAARGLVVQRPGRKTRAVALDESLTLENLGLALHDARSPQARWLLEGYFSLKRQVLVELLVDCCSKASDRDLDRLGSACFRLQDAARWESGATCAQAEFDLLREAARVAERPGHVLLVQSLQRAFMGGAAKLLPLLGGAALRAWASRAMAMLHERDGRALQHELPALMKACDELVLNAFAPAPRASVSAEAPHKQETSLGAPARDETLEPHPCNEEGSTANSSSAALHDEAPEHHSFCEEHSAGSSVSATVQVDTIKRIPCIEKHDTCVSTAAQDVALERNNCGEERSAGSSVSATVQVDTLKRIPCIEEPGACVSAPAQDVALERSTCGEEKRARASALAAVQVDALKRLPCIEEIGACVSPAAQDVALERSTCGEEQGARAASSTTEHDGTPEPRSDMEKRAADIVASATMPDGAQESCSGAELAAPDFP